MRTKDCWVRECVGEGHNLSETTFPRRAHHDDDGNHNQAREQSDAEREPVPTPHVAAPEKTRKAVLLVACAFESTNPNRNQDPDQNKMKQD
jgi:hypothetical protein